MNPFARERVSPALAPALKKRRHVITADALKLIPHSPPHPPHHLRDGQGLREVGLPNEGMAAYLRDHGGPLKLIPHVGLPNGGMLGNVKALMPHPNAA